VGTSFKAQTNISILAQHRKEQIVGFKERAHGDSRMSPIFQEVQGKSIGGDLDGNDEGSE
jgi:hypothetical protein